MSDLLSKLGINGQLLLAQAVNFLILLYLLNRFAYKPLLKAMKDRRTRIEEGLTKAKEADQRLLDAQDMAKDRLRKAEAESLTMLRATEERGKKVEAEMLAETRRKETEMLAAAERAAEAQKEEAAEKFRAEAGAIVRQALVKAVGMEPGAVDEALVKHAVEEVKART